MRETIRTRLETLERNIPLPQRLAVEAMRAAGLGEMAARMGGAGAAAWIGAVGRVLEGIAIEDEQRIAAGEDPADVLAPEQLVAWELRSAKLDALEAELTDPG